MNAKIYRLIKSKPYMIFVDNHKAETHNINIDYPCWCCFAVCKTEAINKMKQSDFIYKDYEISSIKCLN